MATELCNERVRVLFITKHEAAQLIGLLAAQRAGTSLSGNMAGAAPLVRVTEQGAVKYELEILVR